MKTHNEALEILEKNKDREHMILEEGIIEAALLVEICSHKEYGLMTLAVILSLAKQKKRKVILKKETGFTCPHCGNSRFWRDGHYCKDCGQFLDWEYEEEVDQDGEQ